MPSPFPGMDPYLESAAYWRDVHARLITQISALLQPKLRPAYNARVEERLMILPLDRAVYADVSIHRRKVEEVPVTYAESAESEVANAADRPLAQPWIVSLSETPPSETYVEIIRADSREVVTVIEVLSPTNKTASSGFEEYARKRRELLGSRVNVVEIDLLSQGIRPFPQPLDCDTARCRYMIGVSRASSRDQYELYPIALSEMLPRFGIPLRIPDADVPLDLQLALNRCYDEGAYEDLIDYTQPPSVVLTEAERLFVANRATSQR
jgi:hypothetical protein